MDVLIYLRAHHGMCLQYFEGKGYNNIFTNHMKNVIKELSYNPIIKIVNYSDEVCSHCPNLCYGKCETYDLVKEYDDKVLNFCNLKSETIIRWEDFQLLVRESILKSGKRKEICSNCSWNNICSEKDKAFIT